MEPAQLGQCRDDVFADPVRKIFLLGLATQVDERQHRDRRAIQRRELRGRRLAGLVKRRMGALHAGTLHMDRYLDMDIADKAKAFARDRADHGLILAGVADRLSRGIDPAGQCGFGDRAAAPNPLDQIVLGDDTLAALDQIGQQVEYLRFDGHGFAAARQLPKIRIKYTI